MHRKLKSALATLAVLLAGPVSAEVTFYEHSNFEGRAFTTPNRVDDFRRFGFNDRVSSVVVTHQPWEVCEHVEFGGQCVVLRPGRYRSLGEMRMNDRLSSARPARHAGHHGHDHGNPRPVQGQIAFFEHGGFHGRAFQASGEVGSFQPFGFNDRASSVIVLGERWEACEHAGFQGRCVILRPGRYPSLGAMGLNDTLSSVRPVPPTAWFDEVRYAPIPEPVYDWRRRPQERFYEAQVTSAQAVFAGPQQQRCWIERDRVTVEHRNQPNVGGAVVGGILGGILGHQIGAGSGRDLATAGGAVIGAVVGANVGRETVVSRPTQRCAAVPPQGRPDYWDVSYQFRGVEHRVQTTFPPGPTLTVNDEGEPRI
ncbi:MAG TPA: beta/gamma crystallin-related protein [Ideonella sp.]|uniref:beta/gamma crystallin-related protein n=1 Tax=Ideonella sp. TaxID=1929293 RepID=UPI002E34C42A|nr:beta/gamma crystallin-related protein [Ideonella sp.]HEX5687304.1 beta/gamma crystallin-related protein [Ideonella sp.]